MTANARPDAAARKSRAPGWRDWARRLRGLARQREASMVALAILVGIAAGLAVTLISAASSEMHAVLFGVYGERLSAVDKLRHGYLVPMLGGGLLGVSGLIWHRYRRNAAVDPIEANALHGGHMSLRDSLWVTLQTLVSNGCGASVGLEAGYAQMGSGMASRLGIGLRLRRNDLRVLVGCGAAGAIGAAFNAPLTGAFYAFELIVGAYTVANVAPILAASLAGVLTARLLGAETYAIAVPAPTGLRPSDYVAMILLGVLCAGLGVAIMRAVAVMEGAFEAARIPRPVRPAVGGLVVIGLALVTPQVLASGHGALQIDLPAKLSIAALALLFGLKALASVVSLGSGFRGGLFFASLFLGALAGKLFAAGLVLALPQLSIDPLVYALVGMAALAVAVVGGPLTMSFLVLETTGDFNVAVIVLAACVVASLMVRETFGYSFSTWRLHLRGETIRSAIDVGWMRSLTVGRMMRRDPPTIASDASLSEMRRRYPLGSTQRAVVVDGDGRYLGIALTAEAFASGDDPTVDAGRTVADITHWADSPLLPSMNVKEAVALFDQAESEALGVVDDAVNRRVIGLLTEAYALRRYAEELDKARQSLAGA